MLVIQTENADVLPGKQPVICIVYTTEWGRGGGRGSEEGEEGAAVEAAEAADVRQIWGQRRGPATGVELGGRHQTFVSDRRQGQRQQLKANWGLSGGEGRCWRGGERVFGYACKKLMF